MPKGASLLNFCAYTRKTLSLCLYMKQVSWKSPDSSATTQPGTPVHKKFWASTYGQFFPRRHLGSEKCDHEGANHIVTFPPALPLERKEKRLKIREGPFLLKCTTLPFKMYKDLEETPWTLEFEVYFFFLFRQINIRSQI